MSLPIVLMPEHDAGTRHPRILYQNHGTGATCTSDSTATGYDPSNPFNWNPSNYWKPAAGGSHYLQIVTPTNVSADSLGLAQHNLGENDGTFTFQYSVDSGANWIDLVTDFAPVGREQLWWDYDEVTANYWRIVTDSTNPSVLGVVAFGLKYQPYRAKFQGFKPPQLARSFKLYASFSDSGLFLGRSILCKMIKGSIAFDLMELTDAYGDWLTFMKAAEQHAFFLVWMLEDWPGDVQLVQVSGDWAPPSMTEFGYMSTSINYVGLLQE